jgi:hypothetical protein
VANVPLRCDQGMGCPGVEAFHAVRHSCHRTRLHSGAPHADPLCGAPWKDPPLDRQTGAVTSWARLQLPAWRDVAVAKTLDEALRVPVVAGS